jgi:hypothetical protein
LSGLQEILLIIVILVGLFVIPRMIQRPQRPQALPARRPQLPPVSGKMRLAILASAIWLSLAAAFFTPWRNGWEGFAYVGAGVVALAWGAVWVIRGFRKRSR